VIIRNTAARAAGGKPGGVRDLTTLFNAAGYDDFLSQEFQQQELAYPPVKFNINFVKSRFKKDDPDPQS
jgi:hypothetical protein